MTPEEFEILNKKHPYLTYIKFYETEIIGIIQNIDNQMVSIYDYGNITNKELKKRFVELGKLWWEDSNQKIPINIFLREDFIVFKKTLKCLPKKDVKELWGPTLSLEENFQKRIKRRRIQLIRTDDK